MILGVWPGRALALALLVPALLSLGLFVTGAIGPAVLALDAAIGLLALADLATLAGSGRFRVLRRSSAVGSLGQPQEVELTIENLGRLGRRLRIRDDLPETFAAEPAEFVLDAPCARLGGLEFVPDAGAMPWSHDIAALVSSSSVSGAGSRPPTSSTGADRGPGLPQTFARLPLPPCWRAVAELGAGRETDPKAGDGQRVRAAPRLHGGGRAEAHGLAGDGPPAQADRPRPPGRRRPAGSIFLIDCGRMMAGDTGGGLSPLDHALNAMLLLAHVALIRGDQVGLLAFSDRVRAYVPPGGGARRIERLVHSVHNVFPELVEPRYDRAFVELEKRCRKRSLVVLVTNLFDDVNAQIVADHLSNLVGRHLPLLVLLRDHDIFALADQAPDIGLGLYQGAAAAALLNWRERTLLGLRRRGVLTLDLFPDEMTAPMINQYLQIKARHLL